MALPLSFTLELVEVVGVGGLHCRFGDGDLSDRPLQTEADWLRPGVEVSPTALLSPLSAYI